MAWAPPSFPKAPDAVLVTRPQSSPVVLLLTWIGPLLAPEASVAKVQSRSWFPTEPVMAQPVKAGSSDQFRPLPAGRSSWMVTTLAMPGPLFDTVMSKPILEPALTGPAGLAVLEISMLGHWTVTEPVSLLLASRFWGSFVAVAEAVLLIAGPHCALVVGALAV